MHLQGFPTCRPSIKIFETQPAFEMLTVGFEHTLHIGYNKM